MKKKFLFLIVLCFIIIFVSGCDFEDIDQSLKESTKDVTRPKVNCSIDNQYKDDYGFYYYIEGVCENNGSKDYDYLQVEFICYDSEGNNLGTAIDNTNNLLSGQKWKYKAMSLGADANAIDHCDYHEVTGW